MIDVTDQAFARAEVRRQKQYFESLVEISPVAVVVMNAHERVTGWNPAAAQLFGYSPEEAIGRLIDDLVLNEDLREEGRDVTHEALERGRVERITRRVRKDGELVDVQMMLVPRSTASTSASTRSTTTSPSSSAHATTRRHSWP